MEIDVPYGENTIRISIDKRNVAGIIYPNRVEVKDELRTVRDAIQRPLNSKSFQDFLDGADEVLCIVNDATRPAVTPKVLKAVQDRIKDKNVKFIIATGIHRAPIPEEYNRILGEYYSEFKASVFVHDAREEAEMRYLGKTTFGTEVSINKWGFDASNILIIGSVEPHYLAGYTGGRKAIVPGIASYKTVEQNHKLALSPKTYPLSLEGNPIHEDMAEAADLYCEGRCIFSIMTVLDKTHRIYAAAAGHLEDSFYAAKKKADEVFSVWIDQKSDIVVSAAHYPLDINLYQTQKTREHGSLAVKEDGILILVSTCREGVGPKPYYDLLSSSDSPADLLSKIDRIYERGYQFGYHNAARMAQSLMKTQIWAVTDLDDETVRNALLTPFDSLQEAVDEAIREKGSNAKILFLMNGTMTVPKLVS